MKRKKIGLICSAVMSAVSFAALASGGQEEKAAAQKEWWQKPGLGIQYQIEQRPGWNWERDFEKFHKSMMDEKGSLKFNGPFCKTDDWVLLSQRLGVDYHVVETK